MSFADALEIKLTLTAGGTAHTVPGGQVKALWLAMEPYGCAGSVSFVMPLEKATDSLMAVLSQNDLVEISLEVVAHIVPQGTTATPLKAKGLATRREFSEQLPENLAVTGNPVLYRYYRVEFADPAAVLWRQHFPCDLMVNDSLKTLFTQYTGEKIALQCDWDALSTQHPMIAVGLGAPDNRASFYDFLVWLVDRGNALLTYDPSAAKYTIAASRAAAGTALKLQRLDVADCRLEFPAVPRGKIRVLNGYSEDPQTQEGANTKAVDPIRRDHLARIPVKADFDARTTLEKSRLKLPLPEMHTSLARFPFAPPGPGQAVQFSGPGFPDTLFQAGKQYRVRSLHLDAGALDEEPTADRSLTFSRYRIDLSLQLESQDDTRVSVPDYLPPQYPFYVEGKITSGKGKDKETTYEFKTDDQTSAENYQVAVPLWENKKVPVTYRPFQHTGQFYFPAYKDSRVLLALYLHEAVIADFLDWKDGSRLPADSLGNQILMGKSQTSKTSIKHSYVDDKPELELRRTEDKDNGWIKFSEGCIAIQTQVDEG